MKEGADRSPPDLDPRDARTAYTFLERERTRDALCAIWEAAMAERARESVEAEVPDDLGILAKERNWPEGLVE